MESLNNVSKTLIHISHLHPLKLVASPEPKPICHACNMLCADQSYSCIHCRYFLHITCATTVRSVHHPSHPYHTLNLELTPAYPHGQYGCDGCGVAGSSFCLRCRECSYDLHLPCAAITHEINHHSHHHPLILVQKNPYPPNTIAICDLCKNNLDVLTDGFIFVNVVILVVMLDASFMGESKCCRLVFSHRKHHHNHNHMKPHSWK